MLPGTKMRDNSCLVTGCTGFLGRYVVQSLLKGGYEVTALGRVSVQGLRTIVADLTSSDLDLGGNDFSTVYHIAGLAHRIPRTETERKKFFQVNTDGTRNLLQALGKMGNLPEAVVLVSTVAVYGLEEGTLLDETTPRNAVEPYGLSKRQAEDALMEWCTQHGVRAGVVRLPLVAGNRAPGNLGAMVQALRRGRYFGVGRGTARRSIVRAHDVGQILPKVAEVGGIFNLTDGYHPSFAELETALSSAMKKGNPGRLPMTLAKAGALVGDGIEKLTGLHVPLTSRTLVKMSSTLTLSDSRARHSLGWNPSRVLDHVDELVDEQWSTTKSGQTRSMPAMLAS